MKNKPIAIIFSDLHLNIWSKFNQDNERTLNHIRVLFHIRSLCKKYKCPALFCGDMLHKPENIDQDLMELIHDKLSDKFLGHNFYCISGNHDIKHVSNIGIKPFSWITLLTHYGFTQIDYDDIILNDNIRVYGVPYIDHNIGLSDYLNKVKLDKHYKNILLLHTDYPGAKDTDGREVGSVENLNLNTLNKFDLVLCGHIHKPQRLSKKVYMIGAPLQQRRTDRDCKMGYWELYPDLSMKFVHLKGYPKFIDVESEDEILDDGNYYTILPPKSSNSIEVKHKITKRLSKSLLAKRYMKAKGIKDIDKQKLLINVLKESES